jgi:hypothetical protein
MKRKSLKSDQLPDFVFEMLADGDRACDWAASCGWVPGSGRCCRQATGECAAECFFHAMRLTEARFILRIRRRRRAVGRPSR